MIQSTPIFSNFFAASISFNMKDRADQDMVKKMDQTLKQLRLRGLTVTEQTLVEALTGKKLSWCNPFESTLFPAPGHHCGSRRGGKLAVIVDNSPTVILLPAGIFDFLQDIDY